MCIYIIYIYEFSVQSMGSIQIKKNLFGRVDIRPIGNPPRIKQGVACNPSSADVIHRPGRARFSSSPFDTIAGRRHCNSHSWPISLRLRRRHHLKCSPDTDYIVILHDNQTWAAIINYTDEFLCFVVSRYSLEYLSGLSFCFSGIEFYVLLFRNMHGSSKKKKINK